MAMLSLFEWQTNRFQKVHKTNKKQCFLISAMFLICYWIVYLYIVLCKASRYTQPWVVAIKRQLLLLLLLLSILSRTFHKKTYLWCCLISLLVSKLEFTTPWQVYKRLKYYTTEWGNSHQGTHQEADESHPTDVQRVEHLHSFGIQTCSKSINYNNFP